MRPQPIFTRAQWDQAQRECFYAFLMATFRILHGNRQFRRAKHVEAMCYALERVARSELKRLIITVPPRHLKSITVAVAFVGWMLGRHPSKKILVASYGGDLAAKHSRDFRRVTQSPDFARVFSAYQVSDYRDTTNEVETTRNGGRRGVSLGGAVTGFGADIIIVDDLMKAADAHSVTAREQARIFFDETLSSRLNDPENGVYVVIQQRLHEDDIVQHLLDKGGWEHINLPAIAEEQQSLQLYHGRTWTRRPGDLLAPELMDEAALAQKRLEMGPRAFEAQYQQNPTPRDGNRVRWEWFECYEYAAERHEYDVVVQSWDTATSVEPGSDFSVCMTFGFYMGKWELLDIYRQRVNYPDLRKAAKRLYRQWNPDRVIIEDASSGRQLVQDLTEDFRAEGKNYRVFMPYRPLKDKEERLDVQCGKLEEGLVLLPEEAPWLLDFKRELLAFPGSRHDDQVDCLSQFLQWTGTPRGKSATYLKDPKTGRPLMDPPRPRGMDFSRFR